VAGGQQWAAVGSSGARDHLALACGVLGWCPFKTQPKPHQPISPSNNSIAAIAWHHGLLSHPALLPLPPQRILASFLSVLL